MHNDIGDKCAISIICMSKWSNKIKIEVTTGQVGRRPRNKNSGMEISLAVDCIVFKLSQLVHACNYSYFLFGYITKLLKVV